MIHIEGSQNSVIHLKLQREIEILVPWEEEEEEAYPKLNEVSSSGACPCSCAGIPLSSASPFFLILLQFPS